MNNNLQIYRRGAVYLSILGIHINFHNKYITTLGINGFSGKVFYYQDGNITTWAWDKRELKRYFKYLLMEFKSENKIKKHFHNLNNKIKLSLRYINRLSNKDLTSLSDVELTKYIKDLINNTGLTIAILNFEIDAIDVFMQDEIEGMLAKNKNINNEHIIDIFTELTLPHSPTFIYNMEKDMSGQITSGANDTKLLASKYWWINLGWDNFTPFDEEHFQQELTHNKHNYLKTFDDNEFNDRRNKYRNSISKYKLSNDLVRLLNMVQKYQTLHDTRKELQCKTNYAIYQIYLEISRRTKWPINDVLWLWIDEIIEQFTKRKIDKKEIAERASHTLVLADKKGVKTISGERARTKYEKIFSESHININEVKGNIVSKGLVRGVAKICDGYEKAKSKIEIGDILICGMTTPDYLIAMKKAGAVVTNEGGITCHAAIISRELAKPCVVGTKNATQVFKDGDLVEVDANNGVVRKI